MSSLQKPQLRDLQLASFKKQGIILAGVVVGSTLLYHFSVTEARRKKYEKFYKHYNAQEHLEEMKAAGVLESHELRYTPK